MRRANNMKKVYLILLIFTGLLFAQRTNLNGLKFCIDPGHGGNNPANDRLVIPDPGVEFWESESNFQKALLLKPMLEAKGAWVMLTRYTNYYPNDDEPSLTARYTMANQNNVHWFHSIHSNATGGTNTSTNYTLLLLKEDIATRKPAFPQADTMSRIMSKNIYQRLRTTTYYTYLDYTFYGGTNGGYNLGVLKGLLMPGELSEGSFHDFYPETRRLMNNSYREMEAHALLRSFLEYYKVPFDSLCIVAGIQRDADSNKVMNKTCVRIMPENKVYFGDSYNNGFYQFDSLVAGQKTIIWETPNYIVDSIVVNFVASNTYFYDRGLLSNIPPKVSYSIPTKSDTNYGVNLQLGVVFTRAMDTTSLRNAFSLTPSVPGTISFTNANKSIIFKPTSPLPYATYFTLMIDSTAKSAQGIPIDGNGDGIPGDPYIVIFRTQAPTSLEDDNINNYSYSLSQNYPNPFNPTTKISYSIKERGLVTIKLFDVLGNEVITLVNELKEAGRYEVELNASNLSSGVYLYTLKAGNYHQTKKMVVVK